MTERKKIPRGTRVVPPGELLRELDRAPAVAHWPRRRGRTVNRRSGLVGAMMGAGLLLAAVVPMAIGTTVINMTTDGAVQSHNGAIFRQGPLPSSAGTGVLDPFIRIGANMDVVKGYNTDFRPLQYQEDSPWTESLLLSTVPIREVDGVLYRVFFLDINQVRTDPEWNLSLDELRLFLGSSPTLTNFDPAANTFSGVPYTPIYDIGDAYIHLNYSLEAGSGDSDMTMLVPETIFDSAGPQCDYGQVGCAKWLYFWNSFGETYINNDGFEEWSTEVLPYVQMTKTATGTFDRTYDWDLDKSGSPLTHNLWAGGSADTDYDIVVDQMVSDSNIRVTGNVTITVPAKLPDGDKNSPDAVITSLSDVFTQAGPVNTNGTFTDCTVPFTVKAGASRVCAYTLTPPSAAAGVNTVTALVADNPTSFIATANVSAFTPTVTGFENVDVTDTFPYPGGTPELIGDEVAGDTTLDNDQTFTCSSDPAMYAGDGFYSYQQTNRAQIVETGDFDDETVTVNCYAPVVSKTADGSFDRTHTWTIVKTGSPTTHNLWAGGSADTDYDIVVNPTATDSAFEVTGSITVQNPNPGAAMLVNLTDSISTGQSATISCPGGADPAALSVPASSSVVCTYSVLNVPGVTAGGGGTNTATATFNSIGFVATDPYTYTLDQTIGYPTINVDDTFDGGTPEALGSTSTSNNFDNDQTFTCSSDPAMYAGDGFYSYSKRNVGRIVETGQTDDETVTVNCYAPVVSKTADGSFDRDWDWTIDKTGDQTELVLAIGQEFLVNYSVTVTASKTEDGYEVHGDISVSNPAGSPGSMDVTVADAIGAANAIIDCGSGDGDTTLTVAAGATGSCAYRFDFGATMPTETTNVATITFNSIDFTASDDFGFDLDEETDECISVDDDLYGVLDTELCVSEIGADLSYTFNYSEFIGPFEVCGPYEVVNTATFVTNDNLETDSDGHIIVIDVPCGGCTLTQGYWKTHSEYGPAPYDDTWALLDAWYYDVLVPIWLDGDTHFDRADEEFFLSGKTWYEVFWIAPAGNAYYQLAHQYQAAVLNILNDASAPTSVTDAIAHAEVLFKQYTPAQIGALKGGNPVRKDFIATAGILGSYNTGMIGPGHCDEDALTSRTP